MTTCLLRERLTQAGSIDKPYGRFDRPLHNKGYLAMSGQILDASLMPAPRQHRDDGGKQAIKDRWSADEIWPGDVQLSVRELG